MEFIFLILLLLSWQINCDEKYWTSLPSGGGGHCNQLEQLFGAIQCSINAEEPKKVMILPDFRADRPAPGRHIPFEKIYDLDSIKKVARVISWSEAIEKCHHKIRIVGNENVTVHIQGTPWLKTTQWCRQCTSLCLVGTNSILRHRSCPVNADRLHAFKSNRFCKLKKNKECSYGFDWSATLNGSKHFLGLIDPDRTKSHLTPCNRRALSRFNARERRAIEFLQAFRPQPELLKIVHQFIANMGKYDAVHIRLGDFQTLCSTQNQRAVKFCPPSADTFRKGIFNTLGDMQKTTRKPVLLISDEPQRFFHSILNGQSFPFIFQFSSSLLKEPLLHLIIEIELAVRAHTFIGLACSTVSQLIIKRRISRFAFSRKQQQFKDNIESKKSSTPPSAYYYLWP